MFGDAQRCLKLLGVARSCSGLLEAVRGTAFHCYALLSVVAVFSRLWVWTRQDIYGAIPVNLDG